MAEDDATDVDALLWERDRLQDALTADRATVSKLRAAVVRACAGYPQNDAAPTCVAILRAALGPNATNPPPRDFCNMPKPCAWVRPHAGGVTGVAHYGPHCPPGWVGAAEPLYDQAALDAAVAAALERCREYDAALLAAEREWWERTAEAMAQEADRKFPLDGTVAIWLRALLAKRGA
jgi:hypothetical protein